ncbi:hypothetical protein CANCADRAFT_148073 [Tortispora caseinolytica NRRL Y-17796]|uniref:UBP-type domain-containing protein n=1 Tax=Tortispora caseinolytica NRRL Y-17796 TaxID=767744 RepID=A0A1E4TG57_9ASCO|nr:hypothetical protein CANCADRAFT_148073 [Tortispora caseinolytica NRRL Y-17796]
MSDDEPVAKRQRVNDGLTDSELYLDTINRSVLNFDFEPVCSITLTNQNIYVCLTCNAYLKGRGQGSPAFAHSINENHHVYMKFSNQQIYILPDGYIVSSRLLEDIRRCANPLYTKEQLSQFTDEKRIDALGNSFIPGLMGLYPVARTNYICVIMQLLSRVVPLRNLLLLESESYTEPLAYEVGLIIRKMWNSSSLKSTVSIHRLLSAISHLAGDRFGTVNYSDPADFLAWLLHQLNKALSSSMVHKVFQGKLILSESLVQAAIGERDKLKFDEVSVTSKSINFLFLTLDLPPKPVFTEANDNSIMAQVTLETLLKKYDGNTIQELPKQRRRYKLVSSPLYLVLNIKRTQQSHHLKDRNNTTVIFPQKLDLSSYLDEATGSQIYHIVANIVFESDEQNESEISYKIQVKSPHTNMWYEIWDTHVKVIEPEYLFLSETCIQLWEKEKRAKSSA